MTMLEITNEDNMRLMARYPDKYFDLAVVDPPYFNGPQKLGYFGKGYSKIGVSRIGYKILGSWGIPNQNYYDELSRVAKEKIIWGINYFDFVGIGPGRIIWDKQKVYGKSFSDAEIASCSMIKSVRTFRYLWDGMRQGDMKHREQHIHPTQKPVNLYKWILQNYAKPGWKILDTHLGSGSIAIACIDMGFDLTACELDGDYYEAAIKRIRTHQLQKELFPIAEIRHNEELQDKLIFGEDMRDE
jgi:site-specific DNA-methyltransferase (adenine-specific)